MGNYFDRQPEDWKPLLREYASARVVGVIVGFEGGSHRYVNDEGR